MNLSGWFEDEELPAEILGRDEDEDEEGGWADDDEVDDWDEDEWDEDEDEDDEEDEDEDDEEWEDDEEDEDVFG